MLLMVVKWEVRIQSEIAIHHFLGGLEQVRDVSSRSMDENRQKDCQ